MRKSLAVLLSILTLALGAPMVGIAQAPRSTSVSGQVVDTGGRGAAGSRLELVSDSMVVATTMSTTDGHFSFPGVPLGSYVVRTYVNGQPIGIRVTATAGSPASALLVLPSVAGASPAVVAGPLIGMLGPVLAGTVAVSATAVTISADDDATTVITSAGEALTYLSQLVAANPELLTDTRVVGVVGILNDIVNPNFFPPGGNVGGGNVGGGGGNVGGGGGGSGFIPPNLTGLCQTLSCP